MTLRNAAHEFWLFGLKQAQACIFAGSFFVLLFLSKHLPLFGLARYDFLFLAAVAIQIILIKTKIESLDEAKAILLYHVIGLALEIFKTNPAIGSWSYPEAGFFKLMNVPLYSGFMYAAIGSYMMQSYRIFRMRFERLPDMRLSIALCAAAYLNFFTHHWIPDFRFLLIALVLVLFARTQALFTVWQTERAMPIPLAFLLIAFFVWIAENISTYFGAWQYPDQVHQWTLVASGKITSWFLLVIISFIIMVDLKVVKSTRTIAKEAKAR
jgi:uncharacterized membrane protein YoaT (DUF817 family)